MEKKLLATFIYSLWFGYFMGTDQPSNVPEHVVSIIITFAVCALFAFLPSMAVSKAVSFVQKLEGDAIKKLNDKVFWYWCGIIVVLHQIAFWT